jgi:hypothetical protein
MSFDISIENEDSVILEESFSIEVRTGLTVRILFHSGRARIVFNGANNPAVPATAPL